MTRWYPLEPVTAEFFESAPQIFRYPCRLPVPPARVWESLTSDKGPAAWGPAVRDVRWTSPRPFGVGSTRDVVLSLGVVTVREEFFRWDEGRGYSFFARAANRPGLRRFAENYVLAPDGTGTLFTVTFAVEAAGRAGRPLALLAPLARRAFGEIVREGKHYLAARP